ncbi:putative RNA methyltransferase [Glycomyces xiaoerkulensis]|uniref:putative RNA methyltransferase n=1 Tax=Glycomyces xiaoerkulensis TaxID=2038139 RepID=UPI000C26B05A|nr:methyltransferase domain-containing protein [Glycomyces xiaoerkulensis]
MTLPALQALACPNCTRPLAQTDRRLHCPAGHSFDLAKHGYAPLLAPGSNATTGDTADQVEARDTFLDTGHYDPLLEAVAAAAATDRPGAVVEPGCGTGHYLARTLQEAPDREGIGLDTSKYALRRAARRSPRLTAVLADAWTRLPVRDGAAAAVLNVFAPRNPAELARILRPGGTLTVLTPRPDHLRELVDALGLLQIDPHKTRRTAGPLEAAFTTEHTEDLTYRIRLTRADALHLAAMGPSARHHDPDDLTAAVDRLPEPVETTVAATVTRWRRRDQTTGPADPIAPPPGDGHSP